MAPGYEHDFLNEEKKDDELYCAICQHVIKEATHGSEAHVFCKECIHLYIQKSNNGPILCPGGCRIEINPSELSPSKIIDRLILNLLCRCKYCDWQGTLLNLEGHHLSHCENRPFPCRYEGCDLSIKRKDLEKHNEKCLYKPIECTHCNNIFPRKFMESHDSECLKKVVPCPYYNVGCQYQSVRDSMKQHADVSLNYHVVLSNQHILKRISNLENENNILKEENKCLQIEVQSVKGDVVTLEKKNSDYEKEVVTLKKKNVDYEKEINISKKKQEELLSEITELKKENETVFHTNKELSEKILYMDGPLKFLHNNYLTDLQSFVDDKKHLFQYKISFSKHFNTISTGGNSIYFIFDRFKNSIIDKCLIENNFSAIVSQYLKEYPDLSVYEEKLNSLMKIPTSFIFKNTEGGFIYCFNLQTGPVIEFRDLKLVCLDDRKYKLIEKCAGIKKVHVIYKGNDLHFESKNYYEYGTHVIDLTELYEQKSQLFFLPEKYLIVMYEKF